MYMNLGLFMMNLRLIVDISKYKRMHREDDSEGTGVRHFDTGQRRPRPTIIKGREAIAACIWHKRRRAACDNDAWWLALYYYCLSSTSSLLFPK